MRFSSIEINDLIKAWLIISIAFAIMFNRGINFNTEFLILVLFSAVTVGIGFLFHEIAHKIVAQRYGCWAEFRANNKMLILALLISFLGIVFAAPGAVMISGRVTKKQNGIISIAGPLTNLAIAILFIPFIFIFPIIAAYGIMINSWIALFNMIPFGIFDGRKVINWSKTAYVMTVIAILIIIFIRPYIIPLP
jgi:Zn-dependent protease